jgi:hypothetical protein
MGMVEPEQRRPAMRPSRHLILALAACLAACSAGNVKSAKEYSAPAAAPVRNPLYNPYAAYGEANATWQPPVWNRDGTIVKPAEPSSQDDRPAYEFGLGPPEPPATANTRRRAPSDRQAGFGASYPRKGDTKQQASGRPIIHHVQQPDSVIVAMPPINDRSSSVGTATAPGPTRA